MCVSWQAICTSSGFDFAIVESTVESSVNFYIADVGDEPIVQDGEMTITVISEIRPHPDNTQLGELVRDLLGTYVELFSFQSTSLGPV